MPSTLEVIWHDLPNGFHDAELHELVVDLVKAEVRLCLKLSMGNPEATSDEEREARRLGVLRLEGVTSMLIEPPTAGYEFTTGRGAFLDGDLGPYPGDPAPPDDGLVRLWFCVSTWNSRMLFTAKTCELEWAS
jgi:hypothetical protein